MGVLTHCNAGGLATSDYGTALAVIYAAEEAGKRLTVYADETRPLLQGARLTAWELQQRGVDVTVICDSMAAQVMREKKIQAVITGADRIAANGDVANKIGTYSSAVVAHANNIPFYVAAPTTTIDPDCPTGSEIPIEERGQDEVLYTWGWSDDGVFQRVRTAPQTSSARNPAFDVTPADLVAGIITEKGIVPATQEGIARVARRS